jgi:hypothetical protein
MQVWAPEILCVGRGYLRMRERKSEREKQRERETDIPDDIISTPRSCCARANKAITPSLCLR